MTYTQTGSTTYTSLVVILVIGLSLAVAVMLLPKGFSHDLSKIGQGSVVVVLTNDKNTVRGMEVMALLNDIRSDYKGRVEFLSVDVASSKGQAFSQQQRVGSVVLVVFGPDGRRLTALGGGINEKELRLELDNILAP